MVKYLEMAKLPWIIQVNPKCNHKYYKNDTGDFDYSKGVGDVTQKLRLEWYSQEPKNGIRLYKWKR